MFPLSLIIMAVITAASFFAWQNTTFYAATILEPYKTWRGKKLISLLSSGFIHADLSHLFFNLIAFYFFGTALENYYSLTLGFPALWVLFLFLLGVLAGNILTVFLYRDRSSYRSLGASGGVSAIVFAAILLNPMAEICLYFIFCLPGLLMGALFLGYSIYQSKNRSGNINHEAHLAGALLGIGWQTILTPFAWQEIANLITGII
jgi:membrane associated rhomboid family serine protease